MCMWGYTVHSHTMCYYNIVCFLWFYWFSCFLMPTDLSIVVLNSKRHNLLNPDHQTYQILIFNLLNVDDNQIRTTNIFQHIWADLNSIDKILCFTAKLWIKLACIVLFENANMHLESYVIQKSYHICIYMRFNSDESYSHTLTKNYYIILPLII